MDNSNVQDVSKNLCGKTVKRENAYEIWQTLDGEWTWYVLKKYQSPEKEADNPYARWFCDVVTPIVPNGEMGDTYIKDIKDTGAIRIDKKEPVYLKNPCPVCKEEMIGLHYHEEIPEE